MNRHGKRLIRVATATGAVAALAVLATGASANNYNWGTNGSGSCTGSSPNASSEWNGGNCVMSLSGWANFTGWVVAYPVQTCEDTVNGPYPTNTPGSNQAPGNLQAGPFYASVQWIAENDGSGWAWQGDDIDGDSDAFNYKTTAQGSYNPSTGTVTTWGSATGAFGPSVPETKSAQYAAGCLNATGAGQMSGLITNAREAPDAREAPNANAREASAPALRVRLNPNPAERRLSFRAAKGVRGVQRRITLRPNASRTIRVACPKGTGRLAQQVWPEFAPADGRAPKQSSINASRLRISKKLQSNGMRLTVKSGKLAYVTMVQAQIRCK